MIAGCFFTLKRVRERERGKKEKKRKDRKDRPTGYIILQEKKK